MTDHSQTITNYTTDFLHQIGFAASFTIQTSFNEADSIYNLLIQTDQPALFIGFHGETLNALQIFLSLHLNSHLQEKINISLNVNDYKERRQTSIESLTDATVSKVIASGRPHALPPMSAADRRLVHMHLTDHPEVTTSSQGEGRDRSVVISLKDAATS